MAKDKTKVEKTLSDIKRKKLQDPEYLGLSTTDKLLTIIAELLLDIREKK